MSRPRSTVVLHVLEAVRGGTSRHVRDVVRHSPGRHHVAVPPAGSNEAGSGASYDQAAVDEMADAGATIHLIGMRRSPLSPANATALAHLVRLIREVRPDVVHGHSSMGGVLGRLAALTTGRPSVYTANGLATGRRYRMIERSMGPITGRFVATSTSEAAEALELKLVPPERVVVIPNGIELEMPPAPRDLREELGVPADAPLLGTIARLVDQKSPVDFVRICGRVAAGRPDAHFLIIGHGPLQPEVDAAVDALGIRATWHQIDVLAGAASYLGQLDVFALPSRFEGGPYAPLEAIRAGVPVVLSDVVGNRDVVDNGVSGALLPFGDTDAMGQEVLRLLDDGAHRDRMVSAAHARLTERFDIRRAGETLGELYTELADPVRRRRTRRLPHPRSSVSSHRPESSASQ